MQSQPTMPPRLLRAPAMCQTCQHCGSVFIPRGYRPEHRPPRYCSPVCTRAAQTTSRTLICTLCGQAFKATPTQISRGRLYCTRSCWSRRPLDAAARFWSRVQKTSTCWLWTGAITGQGYGLISLPTADGEMLVTTHRFAWEVAAGPVPPGLSVCHNCPDGDDRVCVRNDEVGVYLLDGVEHPRRGHLWLGTQGDNIRDAYLKGRRAHAAH